MTTAIYVFGAPGAGKSTLVKALMEACGSAGIAQEESWGVPLMHHLETPWRELGKWRPTFGGTDSLSYSIAPRATALVTADSRPHHLIGEGDRLTSTPFFKALQTHYDRFVPVFVEGSHTAWAQMLARAEALGKEPQTESWWKGRDTKSRRLAAEFASLHLVAGDPIDALVQQVMAEIS